MYAVIVTGGKQYKVAPGEYLKIEKLEIATGESVTFDRVLLVANGDDVNIGAGTITCNYDGVNKNKTKIGDRVFIGSDTMLIAPIEIGNDAYTGAGSVINKNLPPDALGIERSPMNIVEGWARRKKNKQHKENHD